MMSDGFITTTNLFDNGTETGQEIELQIKDLRVDLDELDVEIEEIVQVKFKAFDIDADFNFNLFNAKAFVEAMQEIISCYEK